MAQTEILPGHIGIIMDGNGRWAQARGKSRNYGHLKGSENVDRILTYAFNRGVKVVTMYAFSCENWSRPQSEIDALMDILRKYFRIRLKKALRNKIRINVIGDVSKLPADVIAQLADVSEKTAAFTDKVFNIALNYGGRQEIVKAVKELIADNAEITEQSISERLYTAPFGEPDLIIRTSGEYRLSNFLLYQGAYAELYFTEVMWPDFNEAEFDKALDSFSKRNRRYGNI